MEKHSVSRLSYLFAHLHLLSYSFSSDLLSSNLPLLSASALLCFSSVHIVGSLTSKLPSTRSLFFFAKPLCWFLNETSTRLRGKHIRKHRKCWARLQEMTQFSDIDLSRPVCNSLWGPVKEKANLIAATNDSHFCGSCTEQLKETQPIQEPVENDHCESCSI